MRPTSQDPPPPPAKGDSGGAPGDGDSAGEEAAPGPRSQPTDDDPRVEARRHRAEIVGTLLLVATPFLLFFLIVALDRLLG